MITGVADLPHALVPLPDGWWVELVFNTVPRIGG